MKRINQGMEAFLNWAENNIVMAAIRRGMVLTMPILLISAMSNAMINLPIGAYQKFLTEFAGGRMFDALNGISNATNGMITLVMIITISYSFGAEAGYKYKIIYTVCAVCSFVVYSTEYGEKPSFNSFSATWMFTGMCVTLISCGLLYLIYTLFAKQIQKMYAEGVDSYYQSAMSAILPVGVIIIIFLLLNLLVTGLGSDLNFQNINKLIFTSLFSHTGLGLGGVLLYVFLIHFLWFFGIHGDNVLFVVTYMYIIPTGNLNRLLAAAGQVPTEIFSNSFFNYFMLMGGTGATLCLVFAIFIVSRKANNKRLAKISVFPALFNINEPMLWGFPIILNPYMLVPFLAAPIAIVLFSALMMKLGIVPLAIYDGGWTLPVFFSGYKTTGSIMGALLQAVNLVIGTAIYIPFVKKYEERQTRTLKDSINQLSRKVMAGEESEVPVTLLSGNDRLSSVAGMLVEDLRHAMKNGEVQLYYQPQIRHDSTVLGAEALLRWNHPALEDYVYPPLVIELAKEAGYLDELGLHIIEEAVKALSIFSKKTKKPIKISVNISAAQLENPQFCDNVIGIMNRYDIGDSKLAIEITEQISLSASAVITNRIDRLHDMGIEFIMDDFGMGHSSIIYLKNNKFSYVKLDGSIVKDLMGNERIGNIIDSIKQLSQSLGFDIIAEYVEEQEQRDRLEELGCHIYQGWLYSKAINIGEFEMFLHEYGALKGDL